MLARAETRRDRRHIARSADRRIGANRIIENDEVRSHIEINHRRGVNVGGGATEKSLFQLEKCLTEFSSVQSCREAQ